MRLLPCSLAGLLFLAAGATAQSGLYPFTIDQDALAGAPDFSALNRPLTAADALVVRDGHFVRAVSGERVRLFGVNLAFDSTLPLAADAPRIARRLRRLGINVVRLHHMDARLDDNIAAARALLTTGPYPTLNPESVALLRGFLDALSVEGIYVNLNLHVSYTFRPAVDGVPAIPAGATFPIQSKPLHIFHPRMVELQAEFTRQLLDALRLGDDPVLAMVEINNETSLVREWQSYNLDGNLFPAYADELRRQWNTWLAGKYAATEPIAAAWGASEPAGPELLTNGGFAAGTASWQMEVHAPAQATLGAVSDAGAPAARVDVRQIGGYVFLKQVGLSLERGVAYEATCEVRADLAAGQTRRVTMYVSEDVSPWRTQSSRALTITSQWQRFTLAFEPTIAINRIGRFALQMESATGVVLARNCSLRRATRRGLDPGEALGSIALVGETEISTAGRTNDYLLFLAATDRAYLQTLRAAVRDRVVRPVPIAGTQMRYGGLLNLDSHADLDYHDNHSYVDHYDFPNVEWDYRDWRIRNTGGIGTGLGGLQNTAAAREAGRPYTLSEFNLPWPNTQATEVLPVVAAFAAFQDWDAIMYFAYEHRRTWDDNVARGFNLNTEPHKLAQVGQTAWLFRAGAVRDGRDPITLPLDLAARLQAGRERRNFAIPAFLQAVYGYDPNLPFVRRVAVARSETDRMPALPRISAPYVSDTNELTYDLADRIYRIHAERAAGVFGYLGARARTAGPLTVEMPSGSRGFAAVLLTPLDGRPLAASQRMLLTAPGYALRSLSNGQPQELVRYGSATDWFTLQPEPGSTRPSGHLDTGVGPNWMESLGATITLDVAASDFVVFPLDERGARRERLPVQARRFRLGSSPWYEIVSGTAAASRSGAATALP